MPIPYVSVVIPTRNRPELVTRAVESALAQTYDNLEVIVVIDGLDPATTDQLSAFHDPRLLVVALETSVGGAGARNLGSREARGRWIAFLDDDDEWLPHKIDRQIEAAEAIGGEFVFIASLYIERSERGDRVLPICDIDYSADFSEFLFCRRSLRGGTGYVQTSTWLISRSLIEGVPFTNGLKRNQDVDWMLKAMSFPGTQFHIVPEPLAIFNEDYRPNRVSKQADWKFQFDWAHSNRRYLTSKAFSFCIATLCVPEAVRQRAPIYTYVKLLTICFREGRVTLRCLLFFLYYWLLPETLRKSYRRFRATG